jgi:hypothetical protein
MRLAFVTEAADAAGIAQYRLILIDCDDATGVRRLARDRKSAGIRQPDNAELGGISTGRGTDWRVRDHG